MALSWTNYSYQRWLRQHGMYEIVKGALRPAAHQALSFEHPYFDRDSRIHRSEGGTHPATPARRQSVGRYLHPLREITLRDGRGIGRNL